MSFPFPISLKDFIMKKILSLIALGFVLSTSGVCAQTLTSAEQIKLDRDKQSLAASYKRNADELSCGPMTHPGARKQCIFYRDVNDEASKCAQRSITAKDLKDCRDKLYGEERELARKPYSWFDDRLATCREKMTATEDAYKKLYEKEKAAGTFTAVDIVQLDKSYTFWNEGHDRNKRLDFFKQTQDQCIIQTEYYAAGIALINTKIKAKPQITIKKANYGENCANVNKSKMDIAKLIATACDSKLTCSYTMDAFKTTGDPAPNCAKELVVTYSCGSADKTVKLDKEAHGKTAQFDCSK
jgi:hypothetical protein